MSIRRVTALFLSAALIALPAAAQGTGADLPGLDLHFRTMGQPRLARPFFGTALTVGNTTGSAIVGGLATLGMARDVLLPLYGVLGVSLEGYGGVVGGDVQGGARLLATSPAFFFQAGVDWEVTGSRSDLLLSLKGPFRRGGILGGGTELRLDWLPTRQNTINVGLQVPLGQHWAGLTRPRQTDVDLPPSGRRESQRTEFTSDLAAELGRLRHSARLLFGFEDLLFTGPGESHAEALEQQRARVSAFRALLDSSGVADSAGRGRWAVAEADYHCRLDRVFGLAAGAAPEEAASKGAMFATEARQILLEEVLLPYDRLFGQYKARDGLQGLGVAARQRFSSWVRVRSGLGEAEQETMLDLFDQVVDLLDNVRRMALRRADGDTRLVWVPMQLVLRPEQHVTQQQIDDLIALGVGRPWTVGNAAIMVQGQQFTTELIQTLRDTRSYHVLWVHDYPWRNDAGKPDSVAWAMTVSGYLSTLAQKVREFDHTGALPYYILFLDEHYYDARDGRVWMSLLENPLGTRLKFPAGYEYMAEGIRQVRDSLRAAMAGSVRLQAEAARRGSGWLRRAVSIHVNITYPPDLSFRSRKTLTSVPILPDWVVPDGVARDHRKIAFRDVTDRDPDAGRAIYTGTGVGDHYTSQMWEDRALVAEGPELLTLKADARRLLLDQGYKEVELPPPLRAAPRAADFGQRVAARIARGANGRALQVHNGVGFAPKSVSVMQVMLYTLMPEGSTIWVPSPIWTQMLWVDFLLGASLRGCHVHVIAPSDSSAPSSQALTMARSRELLARLLEASLALTPELQGAGGTMRVGLYTRHTPVANRQADRLKEVFDGHLRYPWLRSEFPASDQAYAMFREFVVKALHEPGQAGGVPVGSPGTPKLHRKNEFFATRETLQALMTRPELVPAYKAQVEESYRAIFRPDQAPVELQRHTAIGVLPFVASFESLAPELRPRAVLYMTVGSMNKDDRSMYLDGEDVYAMAGPWSLQAFTELFFVAGSTTWLAAQSELDSLLTPRSENERRRSHDLRKAI